MREVTSMDDLVMKATGMTEEEARIYSRIISFIGETITRKDTSPIDDINAVLKFIENNAFSRGLLEKASAISMTMSVINSISGTRQIMSHIMPALSAIARALAEGISPTDALEMIMGIMKQPENPEESCDCETCNKNECEAHPEYSGIKH